MTISLAAHFASKRQSDQATYTVPDPSISAEGRVPARRLPAMAWWLISETMIELLQLAPPSLEVNASMAPGPNRTAS